MNVSIVIPMFNEEQHIVRTIRSVQLAAKEANWSYEIIAVDNGSSDQSVALAKQMGASVLICPHLTIGAMRNAGAEQAQGELLAFIDADIEMPLTWFNTWQALNAQQSVDILAVDCDTPQHAPWFAIAWQKRSLSAQGSAQFCSWLPSANLLMPRILFERIKGFNPVLRTGEDKEFSLNASATGAKLMRCAESKSWHWGFEKTWKEWFGKEQWRQGSHLQLLAQEFSVRLLRFPLLCFLQFFISCLIPLLLLGSAVKAATFLAMFSTLPAAFLALRQSYKHREITLFFQLWFLHWLRLHIGGYALIKNVLNGSIRRPTRG